jgi:hypothetical protein
MRILPPPAQEPERLILSSWVHVSLHFRSGDPTGSERFACIFRTCQPFAMRLGVLHAISFFKDMFSSWLAIMVTLVGACTGNNLAL